MVNRLLLGQRTSGTYGLDFSKPGFDVTTAADKDLIFSSKWGTAAGVRQRGTCTPLYWTGSAYAGNTVSFTAMDYTPLIFFQPVYGSANPMQTALITTSGGYDLETAANPVVFITTSYFQFIPPPSYSTTLPATGNYMYFIFNSPGGYNY